MHPKLLAINCPGQVCGNTTNAPRLVTRMDIGRVIRNIKVGKAPAIAR